jgi:hypothetical protein
MPPYEAENAIANLVKAWVKERVDRLKGWIDQSLQQEVILLISHTISITVILRVELF